MLMVCGSSGWASSKVRAPLDGHASQVPGDAKDLRWVEFIQDVKEPSLAIVNNEETVVACSVKWRSWLWQYHTCKSPASHDHLGRPPIPRLFVQHGPEPLIKIAARCAFWTMPVTDLQKIAQHRNIELGAVSNLCDMVCSLVQKTLQCSDDETMQIATQRLATNDVSASFSKELLELDEALDCMDQHDAKRIHQQQHEVRISEDERRVFVQHFQARRRAIDDSKME